MCVVYARVCVWRMCIVHALTALRFLLACDSSIPELSKKLSCERGSVCVCVCVCLSARARVCMCAALFLVLSFSLSLSLYVCACACGERNIARHLSHVVHVGLEGSAQSHQDGGLPCQGQVFG